MNKDKGRLIDLLRENNMSTDGWFTASLEDCPIQIWDKKDCNGRYHAIINRNDCGRIRIFDREYSGLVPIVDTGWDPITAKFKADMLAKAVSE